MVIEKHLPSLFYLIFNIGKCDCFVGYNGQTCEKKMNCAGNNCSNHGKCNILTGKCACTKGYEGQFCNITRDICLNKNCSGNGVCLSATGLSDKNIKI